MADDTVAVEPDTLVVVNGRAENSEGKTDNAPRMLSLDNATISALREWCDVQRSERAFFDRDYCQTDRVFTWENGRDIHPDVVRQRFLRFLQRCGLPRIRLHDMRHTYATIALKSGVNPKIVSARLGHASVGFTLTIYSHALPGYDRDAAGSVADLILGKPQDNGLDNADEHK